MSTDRPQRAPTRAALRRVAALALVAALLAGCASSHAGSDHHHESAMRIHYLEIVSPDVDAVCAAYAAANGLAFGEPVAALGNARTAPLPDGGMVGVRAPLSDDEQPVTRPYWLVPDIDAALSAAEAAGALIAHPPLEIPGLGRFAIYFAGDTQQGLWQL